MAGLFTLRVYAGNLLKGSRQRTIFLAGLFTLRVFARNLLRGILRRNSFLISFLMTDLAFTSNKATHYILDYGDYNGAS